MNDPNKHLSLDIFRDSASPRTGCSESLKIMGAKGKMNTKLLFEIA